MSDNLPLVFSTEPVEGWRVWRVIHFVDADGQLRPRLAPIFGADMVFDPEQKATCLAQPHAAPNAHCECGYWVLHTREMALEKLGQIVGTLRDAYIGLALGRVKLTGNVVEFEKGFRSERMRPLEIWCSFRSNAQEMRRQLSEDYGVPVEALDVALPALSPIASDTPPTTLTLSNTGSGISFVRVSAGTTASTFSATTIPASGAASISFIPPLTQPSRRWRWVASLGWIGMLIVALVINIVVLIVRWLGAAGSLNLASTLLVLIALMLALRLRALK